jgi:hypothetical protein
MNVAVRAPADRTDDAMRILVAGDDDGGIGLDRSYLAYQVQAVISIAALPGHDQVKWSVPKPFQGFGAVMGRLDLPVLALQYAGEELLNGGIWIDEQECAGTHKSIHQPQDTKVDWGV